MPVNSTHPQYDKACLARKLVRDVCTGTEAIKAGRVNYLPMANAKDTSPENLARYDSYLDRAVFYEVTKETSTSYVGRAFMDDPTFEPDGSDYLGRDVDGAGISIYQQAQAALKEQLEQSGFGFLVDYPRQEGTTSRADQENNGIRATIGLYHKDNILNWRVSRKGNAYYTSLVVLLEKVTQSTADDVFTLKEVDQYRVLLIDENGFYRVDIYQQDGTAIELKDSFNPLNAKGLKWTYIPFQPVGSFSNDWNIQPIPLEPIARINIAHYHNSADYEDSVYWCGRIQPVITGLEETWRDHLEKQGVYIGSSTPLMLPTGGGFEFKQAQPNTLAKEGMDSKLSMMQMLGARLIEPGSANKTATQSNQDASTQHSILSLCVANLNEAYINCLRWVAEFNGTGDKATFIIKQDFAQTAIDIAQAQQLYNAALAGKISWATYWDYIRTGKLPEHGYEQELLLIENPNPSDVPAEA